MVAVSKHIEIWYLKDISLFWVLEWYDVKYNYSLHDSDNYTTFNYVLL